MYFTFLAPDGRVREFETYRELRDYVLKTYGECEILTEDGYDFFID